MSPAFAPGTMTPRQRFLATLRREPVPGPLPHFELVFFLTMEAFGRVHPSHRSYHQWDQMQPRERALHLADQAQLYLATAERFDHAAIMLHPNPGGVEGSLALVDAVREQGGDRYALLLHGDATFGIPNGSEMVAFCGRIADDPAGLLAEADRQVDETLAAADRYAAHGGLDGFCLCSDYCFNTGPFLSPAMFGEFVTPFLARLIAGYRERGFHVIKHTDGNIVPIVDQLVQTGPHALHSLDPQGGVDIAAIKRDWGDQVALIGNVACNALDSGSDAEVVASVRYALTHGSPGGGYVFGSSNCIYTGMRLERYQLMLETWQQWEAERREAERTAQAAGSC